MCEDESEVPPVIQSGSGGLPPEAIERLLRMYVESLRRMVETELIDLALLAIHRGQQDHVWMIGTYEWVEGALERAGLRGTPAR